MCKKEANEWKCGPRDEDMDLACQQRVESKSVFSNV